jgi:hypothetical protein
MQVSFGHRVLPYFHFIIQVFNTVPTLNGRV